MLRSMTRLARQEQSSAWGTITLGIALGQPPLSETTIRRGCAARIGIIGASVSAGC